VRQPVPAARFDRTPAMAPRKAPRLGEHTTEILEEIGLDRSEIERLAAAKIVRPSSP
jgi:crotonobetainyl-CoA:carnitine CoA-transferase CaiB-like acyl-CoA transferase